MDSVPGLSPASPVVSSSDSYKQLVESNNQDASMSSCSCLPEEVQPYLFKTPEHRQDSTSLSERSTAKAGETHALDELVVDQLEDLESNDTAASRVKDWVSSIVQGIVQFKSPLNSLKKTLSSYYFSALEVMLEKIGIPRSLYDHWCHESESMALEVDPVIQGLADNDLSDHLLTMQAEFKEKGLERFASKEFQPVVRNMKACLTHEMKKFDGDVHIALQRLEKELDALLADDEPVPYTALLVTATKFSAIHTALGYFQCPVGCIGTQKQSINEAELLGLIERLLQVTYRDLTHKVSLAKMFQQTLGESAARDITQMSHLIASYIAEKPDYLMWPCFGDLDYEFFIKASRYSIFPAALQLAPWSFSDATGMGRLTMFSHDFLHALLRRNKSNSKDESKRKQEIISRLLKVFSQFEVDHHVRYCVWFLLFNFNHERNNSLLELLKEGFNINFENIRGAIESGKYGFLPGVTVKHIHAASSLLYHLFPPQTGVRTEMKHLN